MTRRIDADVAVIGGGVIGLSCAYALGLRGKRVVVLERERAGGGAGGVAAGMLAPVSEADTEESELVELALESRAMYPDWVKGIETVSGEGCGYRTEGSLFVALHRDHAEELKRLASIQRRLGFDARLISRDEALEKEPYLSPRVVSGLFVADDRQVNPRRLTRALAAAVRAQGGEIVEGTAAGLVLQNGRATGAATPEIDVNAEAVLIAGGAWSADVWPEAAGPLPMRPVKGQIMRLRGDPIVRHVVRTPDIYLVPRDDGELVVGATTEEQGFDTKVTTWAVMELLREAWRVVPGIAELELAEAAAGLRPALRDHLPAIGETCVEGLFVATGHYRNGVLLAPGTAKHLVALMTEGHAPGALAPFDPLRLQAEEAAARST